MASWTDDQVAQARGRIETPKGVLKKLGPLQSMVLDISGFVRPQLDAHLPKVDGRNPTPLWSHRKPLFVGIYRGIIIPGSRNGGAKWISQPSAVLVAFPGVVQEQLREKSALEAGKRRPAPPSARSWRATRARCDAQVLELAARLALRGSAESWLCVVDQAEGG